MSKGDPRHGADPWAAGSDPWAGSADPWAAAAQCGSGGAPRPGGPKAPSKSSSPPQQWAKWQGQASQESVKAPVRQVPAGRGKLVEPEWKQKLRENGGHSQPTLQDRLAEERPAERQKAVAPAASSSCASLGAVPPPPPPPLPPALGGRLIAKKFGAQLRSYPGDEMNVERLLPGCVEVEMLDHFDGFASDHEAQGITWLPCKKGEILMVVAKDPHFLFVVAHLRKEGNKSGFVPARLAMRAQPHEFLVKLPLRELAEKKLGLCCVVSHKDPFARLVVVKVIEGTVIDSWNKCCLQCDLGSGVMARNQVLPGDCITMVGDTVVQGNARNPLERLLAGATAQDGRSSVLRLRINRFGTWTPSQGDPPPVSQMLPTHALPPISDSDDLAASLSRDGARASRWARRTGAEGPENAGMMGNDFYEAHERPVPMDVDVDAGSAADAGWQWWTHDSEQNNVMQEKPDVIAAAPKVSSSQPCTPGEGDYRPDRVGPSPQPQPEIVATEPSSRCSDGGGLNGASRVEETNWVIPCAAAEELKAPPLTSAEQQILQQAPPPAAAAAAPAPAPAPAPPAPAPAIPSQAAAAAAAAAAATMAAAEPPESLKAASEAEDKSPARTSTCDSSLLNPFAPAFEPTGYTPSPFRDQLRGDWPSGGPPKSIDDEGFQNMGAIDGAAEFDVEMGDGEAPEYTGYESGQNGEGGQSYGWPPANGYTQWDAQQQLYSSSASTRGAGHGRAVVQKQSEETSKDANPPPAPSGAGGLPEGGTAAAAAAKPKLPAGRGRAWIQPEWKCKQQEGGVEGGGAGELGSALNPAAPSFKPLGPGTGNAAAQQDETLYD